MVPPYLSVITLEEIYYGLTSKPNARINTWFQQFFITVKLYQLLLKLLS
ncbi:MAG: type II toxin-antitoxin system VapC family toxin [Microcystis aeruginosa BK11-02]|nr:type II toxin-antitoxin system VapC family toxin [Microcystis aeruginosa BK11-02]